MNWFQHDTAATQDAKIKKLLIHHGAIGYAIYFHCLELIAADISESNLTFELEHDSEIIADNLRIVGTGEKSGREIVETIMRDIIGLGLFTENDGHIFCFKLLKRINLSMASSGSFRDAITNKKAQMESVMIRHDSSCYQPTNQPTTPTNQPTPDSVPVEPKPDNKPTFDTFLSTFSDAWNANCTPRYSCRLSINLTREEKDKLGKASARIGEDWMRALTAIRTYGAIQKSKNHVIPFGYKMPNFLLTGVDDFSEEADPWGKYRKEDAGGLDSSDDRETKLAHIQAIMDAKKKREAGEC